jgi:hypothetical protein
MSGQSSISYYNHLEDYGIKCTPLGETCQLSISVKTLYLGLLDCLKDKKTDLPRISREYSRDRRFLLIRIRGVRFLFYGDTPPPKRASEAFTL